MTSLVKLFLKENLEVDSLILIPGPPSIPERIKELQLIETQYQNRKNPEGIQGVLDMGMTKLFNSVIKNAGHPCRKKDIKKLKNEVKPIIKLHKHYFGAARPKELSDSIGYEMKTDFLETAQSPSYPSGHTTQAFYLAGKLSQDYPELKESFYRLARMIAESRVDRGVHFPSDNKAGVMLAKRLLEK